MDNEKVKQFIVSQRQNSVPDAEIYSFLKQKGVISQPVAPQKTGLEKAGGVAKAVVGGIASGVGGIALTAEDYLARKIVNAVGTEKMKENLAKAPKLQEQFKQQFGGNENPTAYGIGQLGGEIASLAAPAAAVGKAVGSSAKALGAGNTLSKITQAGAEGLAFTAGQSATEGEKQSLKDYALNAGLNMAFPAVGAAAKKIGETAPSRIINSLIKPLQKDFAYGKNPGQTVAELGITANNFDELISNIKTAKSSVGESIGTATRKALPQLQSQMDLNTYLVPIDEAIAIANKSPRTNANVISRLEAVKSDLLDNINQGIDPQSFKGLVGDLTRWTGSASDDAIVNKALKQVYGKTSGGMDSVLMETLTPEEFVAYKKASEQYGNLISAENAAIYRDNIVKRADLISFGAKNSALIAALATVVASGGSGMTTILAGLGGAALDKAMATPAFKTRLASLLSKLGPKEVKTFFEKVPIAKTIYTQEQRDKMLSGVKNTIKPYIDAAKKNLKNPKNAQGGFIELGIGQPYRETGNLTTKILKDLEGKTTVSKQYILDATNRGELKQVERDITRQVLEDMTRGSDNPLIQEARKYKSFDDFEKAFSKDIKRGNYWHITEDPNFKIDANKGPRDMSSLAGGEIDKGKLMITSDLPYWAENYKGTRKYVAKIDMSDVSNSDFFQSERGMGNEFFVKNPKNAKVTKVIPMAEALKESKTFKSWLEKNVNSKEDLSKIYNQAQKSDTINVKEFADKVKSELLPLKPKFGQGYEGYVLPDELRGDVKNYGTITWESPVKTSAGSQHPELGRSDNYYSHSRYEELPDNKTVRIIEEQSDLYQKGRLEEDANKLINRMTDAERKAYDKLEEIHRGGGSLEQRDAAWEKMKKLRDIADTRPGTPNKKLAQYDNDKNPWWKRNIKENIKLWASKGKTKLQFPTGETAMKIEGLGEQNRWESTYRVPLKIEDLEVGRSVRDMGDSSSVDWIITDVLGDGKFKAIPKSMLEKEYPKMSMEAKLKAIKEDGLFNDTSYSESFDISGKVDTNNPIYKFYEKDVQKYLNKFGGKQVVDDKGVSWIEIPIKKEQGKLPVEAFGKAKLGAVAKIGVGTGAVAGALQIRKNNKNSK